MNVHNLMESIVIDMVNDIFEDEKKKDLKWLSVFNADSTLHVMFLTE